ncbi:MAG: hypothetical protein J6331_06295, partial [Lentisphaeria bacterium]|nr:hypothetical protein [Lentisphaeria bacterium]
LFPLLLPGEEKGAEKASSPPPEAGKTERKGPFWRSDFRAARKEALSANKLLLVLFTVSDQASGRSGRAIALYKYSRPFLLQADRDYILVHADLPEDKYKLSYTRRRQNESLRARFGVQYFPTVVVLDPRSPWGGLLFRYPGAPPPSEVLKDLEKRIASHLKRIRAARAKPVEGTEK